MFHVTVRDGRDRFTPDFFTARYLKDRLKEGQRLVLHGKAEVDAYRPGRLEMVNPQIELSAQGTQRLRTQPKWAASCRFTKRSAESARG